MTITPGSQIQASDFLQYFGDLTLDQAFPDELTCVNKISAIYGTGYGTYGYGQLQPQITLPMSGAPVLSAQWQGMRKILENIGSHVGVVISGVPTESELAVGQIVTATGYDWHTQINTLDSVRSQVDPVRLVQELGVVSVRNTAWTTTIQHDFFADFGSEDAARFFFNTGSSIQMGLDLTGAPDAHAQSWANMFSTMGIVQLGASTTVQTGSGGTTSTVGYYDLTDTYTKVFEQFALGAYAANNVTIWAKRANHTGTNGANGARIEIQVILDDQFGTPGDPVQGTVTSTVSSLRAASDFVRVGAPTFLTTLQLDGGGGDVFYTFTDVISTTVEDYNLLTRAYAAGYDPGVGNVVPLYATVRVTATGVIRGLSTGYPACIVPPMPNTNSTVRLIVDPGGVIVGKGGAGGTGAPSGVCGCLNGNNGQPGGPALRLQYATTLLNYGLIGGGGGGGGGGGAECGYIWNASAGGGGGGAGFGAGASTNPCGVTLGRLGGTGGNGDLVFGGAGGASGNGITAVGGWGGNIGQAGNPGQTINAQGGAGGANGVGLQGNSFVLPGSNIGDLRGGRT